MITELSGILISILSTGTLGTVAGGLWYRHHNKKMNLLKEQLETANVDKARIESKSQAWHLYDEQIRVANDRIKELLEVNREKESRLMEKDKRYGERINEVEERFNKQTDVLRKANRELNAALEKINQLTYEKGKQQRVIDHLRQWLCQRPWKDCQRRKPQQVVKPTKYVPLEEYEAETTALIQETLAIERHEKDCDCDICVKDSTIVNVGQG